METIRLLEIVITHLSEFADLEYVKQLQKLVKDSELSHLAPILAKVIKYYEVNGIFPSKKYWIKKWKFEEDKEAQEFLIEYASEIVARLRTEIVWNQVKDIVNTDKLPDGNLINTIQGCLYKYTPEKVNKNFDEDSLADSLRKVLKKKKERGAGLLTYTSIDKYTYGCPFGATTVIGAMPKSGKAFISTTKLPTTKGLVEIGKIKIGDYVYGMDGKPTKVVGVFPQGIKDLYKITFCDGTYEICCKEHLWLAHDRKDRVQHSEWKVLDTETIMQKVKIKSGIKQTRANYSIPFASAIEYGYNSNLIINPYILGCLIGDGQININHCKFTNVDIDVIQNFKTKLPKEYDLIQETNKNITYGITRKNRNCLAFGELLKQIGIFGTKSENKFIPKEYLYASIQDRKELLKGLMDTDGSVTKSKGRNNYSYWTTSSILKDDVLQLVKGLGGYATYRSKPTTCYYKGQKIQCKDTFEIRFSFPNEPDFIPLTCKRKLENFVPKKSRVKEKTITSIEYWGRDDATCIMVDNKSHTYITENFTVTHNSNYALSIAFGAISRQNLKGIYISLEMSAEVIYNRLYSRWLYDKGIYIDNKDIIKGTMSEKDEETYNKYLDEFSNFINGKLTVVTQEDLPELTRIELEAFLIRKDIEMGGLDFVIVDQASLLKYFSGITTTTGNNNKTFDIINAYIRYFTVASYTLFQKPVAMIILNQIKRDEYTTITKRKPVGIEAFAEASEVERSCNIAVIIRNDEQLKASNLFELVLVLNRDGDTCAEYTPNIFIPKHCYAGSFDEEVPVALETTTEDISSLFNFMESVGDDKDLEELFK